MKHHNWTDSLNITSRQQSRDYMGLCEADRAERERVRIALERIKEERQLVIDHLMDVWESDFD